MRDLSLSEVEQVNGGVAPAVYGAVYLAGRLAANPSVRSGAVTAGKWIAGSTAAGFFGAAGAGAWNAITGAA